MFAKMSPEELMKFHDRARAHPRIVAKELWPELPKGAVAAARDLSHYAEQLATGLSLQAENETAEAELCSKICARIKQDLPAYALSLLGE